MSEARSLACRRGPAARAKVYEGGRLVNPDLRPDFPEGQCVRHKAYGIGKVLRHYGTGESEAIEIDFERHGIKRFMLVFARPNIKPEDAP